MDIDNVEFEQLRASYGYTEARRLHWQKRNPEEDSHVITDWRTFLKEHPFGEPWDVVLKSGEWVETGRFTFVEGETLLEGEYILWARAWTVRLCTQEIYKGLTVQGALSKFDAASYWHFNLHNAYAEMRARVLEVVQQQTLSER